jgi:hypothetical protein
MTDGDWRAESPRTPPLLARVPPCFWVSGLGIGLGIWDLGLRFQFLGRRVWGSVLCCVVLCCVVLLCVVSRFLGLGFSVEGSGFRV